MINNKQYVKRDVRQKFFVKSKYMKIMHQKYDNPGFDEFYRCSFVPIKTKFITGNGQGLENEGGGTRLETLKEIIGHSTDFELSYETDEDSVALKMGFDKAFLDLPDKFHFNATIYEMQKQYYHGQTWYKEKREKRIEELGYKIKRGGKAINLE